MDAAHQVLSGERTPPPWPAWLRLSADAFQFLVRAGCVLVVAALPAICSAESLRVTTWNLGVESSPQQSRAALAEAATTLGSLNPDVILLQEVADWRTCMDLADLLKPLEYKVVVCSAFHGSSPNAPAQPQVAILSKQRAFFTWTEAWTDQKASCGGVAFGAIQTTTQRIGFFSALIGNLQAGQTPARLLLADIDSVKGWQTNRVQTFVVAASAGPGAKNFTGVLHKTALGLEQAGLVNSAEELAQDLKPALQDVGQKPGETSEGLFAGPLGFPGLPRVLTAPGFKHPALTSELELDPDKVTTALDIRAESRREREARESAMRMRIATYVAAGLVLCLLWIIALKIRATKRSKSFSPPQQPLPTRGTQASEPSPLRPVIFVNAPAKRQETEATPERPALKPTLRLQNSSRWPSARPNPEPSPAPPARTGGPSPIANPSPRSTERQESVPTTRPSYADPEVRQGVIQDLAGWLKHKLVRRLVTDREQMLQAQQLATRMATTLDNRLARIEAQIEEQNKAYIRRIDELNRELVAAREENRELIRERIAQVKAEMEAARAKVLAEANLNNTSLRL